MAMVKTLQFDAQIICDNSAFEVRIASELSTILREAATRLEVGSASVWGTNGLLLRDSNGNIVGSMKLRHVRKRV